MIYRFVKTDIVDSLSLDTVSFPKVFFIEGGTTVANGLQEQDIILDSLEGALVTVWQPQRLLDLKFGRDFDICIFLADSPLVLKRAIPPPVLVSEGELDGTSPILTWYSAFEIPTRLYRTDIYNTGAPTDEFTLIAEIQGSNTPGAPVTYTDESISLAYEEESASYYVTNRHGTSKVVEFTGDTI